MGKRAILVLCLIFGVLLLSCVAFIPIAYYLTEDGWMTDNCEASERDLHKASETVTKRPFFC